jgi:glucose/arabinose dehydrogenase
MNRTSLVIRGNLTRRVISSLLLAAAFVVAAIALAALLFAGPPAAAAATGSSARAALPTFRLTALAPKFESPTWVGGAGDGTSALLVAEQRGIVWRVAAKKSIALDLRGVTRINGEQGLLAVGVDAKFATTHRVFVYFVLPSGAGQVRSYRFANGKAVAGSGKVVINVPLAPPLAANHNGGQLWSLPDGTLLLSVGDGGEGGDPLGHGQSLSTLMGKVLRITPKAAGGYAIPTTNPFVARAGARKEIYALGLRNPWRYSVDAATGTVWIGDVGQDKIEEIDALPLSSLAGANFGWGRMEGNSLYNDKVALTGGTTYVPPRITYTHTSGGCSVTGGVVYRGPIASLRGWYLYADYCQSKVTAYNPATRQSKAVATPTGIVAFGAASGGNVFAASQQTGRVYRVAG